VIGWTQLALFLPAALLVAISPGANNVHGIRVGVPPGTLGWSAG